MNPMVSVIVPVYRVEKYLDRCVLSLLSQSYDNLEVILVDDGSPDQCPKMCDDFALKDPRIKVIHKPNGGVSSARNAGLENANGEYICFVDSDDYVPTEGIQLLVSAMQDTGCQYLAGMCGIDHKKHVKKSITQNQIIDVKSDPTELLKYIIQPGSYSPYAKIYQSSIIKTHSLRYNEELKCAEDTLFIRQYLSYCNYIGLIAQVVYIYNTGNENSLSKRRYEDFCKYYAEKMKALEMIVAQLPITEQQQKAFLSSRAVHGLYICIGHYTRNWRDETERHLLFDKSIDCLVPWIGESINAEFISPKEKHWWMSKRKFFNAGNKEKLYRILTKQYTREIKVMQIKSFIRQIIKK